jgi:hypothetical protein
VTFLGWLLLGAGTLFAYAAARNLSVVCVVRNVLTGKSASCINS